MKKLFSKLFSRKDKKQVKPVSTPSPQKVSIHDIQVLIDRGNINGLRKIAQAHGPDILKLNDDPYELAAIHWAASSGNKDLIRFYLDEVGEDPSLTRNNNFSPLHSAAMCGHTEIVELLLKKGADVNVQTDPQQYTPAHSAAFGGHLRTLKLLLEYGADISLRNYRNELPIDTAKRQNQRSVVKFFEKLSVSI